MKSTAILGAGPAGLVAARFLKNEGFRVTLFDQSAQVGGHWAGISEHSAVWSNMRTNSSRLMTSFSDLLHDPDDPAFMSADEVKAYLECYASRFNLHADMLLRHRVTCIERVPAKGGFVVRYATPVGEVEERSFDQVIIASGRHRQPVRSAWPGLDSFTGICGVVHSFEYTGPEAFRGARVLVVGSGVSALEIAGELAQSGAAGVISACRRQPYILNKMVAGVPVDQFLMTRYAALSAEKLPTRDVAEDLKSFILRTAGDPRNWGTTVPAPNIIESGVVLNQNFLPMVADGRIDCRPCIQTITGSTVQFEDGTQAVVDGIVLATGYQPAFEFLSEELRTALGLLQHRFRLYKHTFHPDVPGLAFLGAYEVMGPNFPVLEVQARWIAYILSKARPAPTREQMLNGLSPTQRLSMQSAALTFAREAAVEPDLDRFPALRNALLFGPLSPISFRLSGRDYLASAPELITRDASRYGAIPSRPLFSAAGQNPAFIEKVLTNPKPNTERISARVL